MSEPERVVSEDSELRPAKAALLEENTTHKSVGNGKRGRRVEPLSISPDEAAGLLAADTPEATLYLLFQISVTRLGVDTGFEYVVEGAGDALRLGWHTGLPDAACKWMGRLEFGHGICGATALLGHQVVAVHIDAAREGRYPLERQLGVRAHVCSPLMSGNRLLGTLSLASHTREAFDERELEFCRTLAHFAELGIERTRLAAELRTANETVRALLDGSPLAMWETDASGRVVVWSRAAERMFNWTEADVVGQPLPVVPAEDEPSYHAMLERLASGENPGTVECTYRRKDGNRISASSSFSILRDGSGAVSGVLAMVADLTDQKALERQLGEKQKLESLGLLAGGIAHDFNNLLVGILGRASMAAELAAGNPRVKNELELVVQASERAAGLARQLLAYAGKRPFAAESLDLSDVVRNAAKLIESSLPLRAKLELALPAGLPPVEADPTQIQQLVMNLVINAAEAIPEGRTGHVRVSTVAETVDEDLPPGSFRSDEFKPGEYVLLEVSDNGCGMDEEARAKIFSPFFTTKGAGHGLGLSGVAGIVRTCKGAITLDSTPGEGSSFRILLPAAQTAEAAHAERPETTRHLEGKGTVLVVDDEEVVAQVAKAVLQRYGYRVILAGNGQEAIQVFERNGTRVTAVLLDLAMPVMDGSEALPVIKKLRPDVRVIATSGHDEGEARRLLASESVDAFVQKPFTAAQLADAVKTALEGRPRRRCAAGRG